MFHIGESERLFEARSAPATTCLSGTWAQLAVERSAMTVIANKKFLLVIEVRPSLERRVQHIIVQTHEGEDVLTITYLVLNTII